MKTTVLLNACFASALLFSLSNLASIHKVADNIVNDNVQVDNIRADNIRADNVLAENEHQSVRSRAKPTTLEKIVNPHPPRVLSHQASYVHQDKNVAPAPRLSAIVKSTDRPATFYTKQITGPLQSAGFRKTDWQQFTPKQLFGHQPSIDPMVVVLDPGHGGVDPGAMGYNGLVEKIVTLDIAKRTRQFLAESDDIEVVLTREFDYGLSRQNRVNKIRRQNADLAISLHLNHLPQPELTVVESFYAGKRNIAESKAARLKQHQADSRSKPDLRSQRLASTHQSKRLATVLQNHVYQAVRLSNENAINAEIKQETLFVLTQVNVPSVLIELTCLSNNHEASMLSTDAYKNQLAAALADGIREYLAQERLARKNSQLQADV